MKLSQINKIHGKIIICDEAKRILMKAGVLYANVSFPESHSEQVTVAKKLAYEADLEKRLAPNK